MSWLFSQALVEEYLGENCSDGEQSAPKALTAIYQDYVNEERNDGDKTRIGAPYEPGVSAICMARECYALADAMLYARELKEGQI